MRQTSALDPLMPFSPAALSGIWSVSLMTYELWTSSLSTIALRNNLWCTRVPTSPTMLDENQRMVTEKLDAGIEVAAQLQQSLFSLCTGTYAPWWETGQRTLEPYHRRSTANSRRLAAL